MTGGTEISSTTVPRSSFIMLLWLRMFSLPFSSRKFTPLLVTMPVPLPEPVARPELVAVVVVVSAVEAAGALPSRVM